MRWLDRLLHVAKSDAHGVLSSLEDRGLSLEQHLREAELEVERKRACCARLEKQLERTERARAEAADRCQGLDRDVGFAMQQGEEQLARFSIRRWLAARRRSEGLERARDELAGELQQRRAVLEAQERELAELRDRVQTELTSLRARACGPTEPAVEPASVCDEEVELEWLRRRASLEEAAR